MSNKHLYRISCSVLVMAALLGCNSDLATVAAAPASESPRATLEAPATDPGCVQDEEHWASNLPWPGGAESNRLCGSSWRWYVTDMPADPLGALATQWIVAQLNLADPDGGNQGADPGVTLLELLAIAESILSDCAITSHKEARRARKITRLLERFNHGLSGVPTCPDTGCQSHSQCDDGDPCTKDACWNGQCEHSNDDGAPCDDGNACTENSCWNGACTQTLWIGCDDGNHCTQDTCDPAVGCVNIDNTVCEDGNACTKNACDPTFGCRFPPDNGGACDDGDQCTEGTRCLHGQCGGGTPVTCDDDNPCTMDLCEQAWGCQNKPISGIECDDDDVCTLEDSCWEGDCKPGEQRDCGDGNVCTTDLCAPKAGCLNVANDGVACDDGDACTDPDECWDKACGGADVDCDDGNVCTNDSCDPTTGCVYQNADGAPCTDGSKCTLDDSCSDAACVSGPLDSCDDGDECTLDSCDPTLGCLYEPDPACDACPETITLGAASGFNVFACGDYSGLQDSQGAVAVAGSLVASGTSINGVAGGSPGYVVGGDTGLTDGVVFGDGITGGIPSLTRVTFVGGSSQAGSPIDFGGACQALGDTSDLVQTTPAGGSTTVESWGGVRFQGTGTDVNVFRVDASDLSAANTIVMEVPAGAHAVINVDGDTVELTSLGLTGFDPTRTLWNMPGVWNLTLTNVTVPGSILAPRADTAFSSGSIDGQLITANLEGNGELHHLPLKPFAVDPCTPLDQLEVSCTWSADIPQGVANSAVGRVKVTPEYGPSTDWEVVISSTTGPSVTDVWVEDLWWSGDSGVSGSTDITVSSTGAGAIEAQKTFGIGFVYSGVMVSGDLAVTLDGNPCKAL